MSPPSRPGASWPGETMQVTTIRVILVQEVLTASDYSTASSPGDTMQVTTISHLSTGGAYCIRL